MIEYLLLDLDNTLYPKSSGLGRFMGDRMGEFVSNHLGISPDRASELRASGLARHGTTLRWLVHEYDLGEVEEFIQFVHPDDLDGFLTDADRQTVTRAMEEIDLPASILTNSPLEHAEHVLGWLGIRDRFEHIFDIRFYDFLGKPSPSVYTRALEIVGKPPAATLFADDVLQYLLPFRDLGGQAVHIADVSVQEPGIPTIPSIAELTNIIYSPRSPQ